MIQDAYSRKLVANEVHESESAEQAAQLLRQACLREQRAGQPLVEGWGEVGAGWPGLGGGGHYSRLSMNTRQLW